MMKYLLTCLVLLFTVVVRAEDVPQFRGTGGLGISQEKNLPTRWSDKENLRWKAALPGRGLSNPVIAGGRVYVTAAAAYEQKREVVLCFDLQTGKKLWERQVWATGATQCHNKTNMAAPTPVTDGLCVYALFATGDLVCYDRDGDLVWYRSLVGDYPTVGNNVGMASSPILWNDLVVLLMENVGESFAAGIDKRTGENRWRVERPRGSNWVTPIVIQNGKQPEVLFHGAQGIDAHDPATGRKLWSGRKYHRTAFASLSFAEGVVFAPGEKFSALRPVKGDAEPELVWQSLKLKPGYCSPIVYQGFVYVVSNNGVVSCASARTGAIAWTERADGPIIGSPLLADGKLYIVSEKGTTTVLQAGAETRVLGVNTIADTFLASPVASDGAIFLRSDSTLYCIGAKKN